MLRIANPFFLHLYWLLPLLGVFLVWAWRYKKSLIARLGDAELVERLMNGVSQTRQIWKQILLFLAIGLLILALINPQVGTRFEEVKREGIDVFIALDISKSMLAEDIAPNRFEKAKHEISRFIDKLAGDRVGLITFSGLAFVQCPLTLDYSAAKLFLSDVEVGDIPQPGTAVSEAINTASEAFVKKELKHKVLVLITDGEDHEGDPVAIAEEAAQAGMVIYTIGIGSPQGAPIPEYDRRGRRIGYLKDNTGQIVTTRLDVETLEKIAFATGGQFFVASTGNTELARIFNEIAGMEKKELSSREFTQFEDRFQIVLAIALLILLIEAVFTERRRQKRSVKS
ncbi:MAG: VWA domain-containing protein [Calditrichia bacterium]